MGMPIVVDVRDDVRRGVLDELFDWFREVDERFSTYKDGQRDQPPQPGRARGPRLPSRRPLGARPLRRAARGDRRLLRRALRVAADGRSVGPRQGLVGRPRRRAARGARASATTRSTPAATSGMRGAALPEAAWRTGIQHPLELRPDRGDRRGERSRARDLRHLHPRRAHRRPAQRPAAVGAALGHDRRARTSQPPMRYATAAFAMGEPERSLGGARSTRTRRSSILADGTSLSTPGFPFAPASVGEPRRPAHRLQERPGEQRDARPERQELLGHHHEARVLLIGERRQPEQPCAWCGVGRVERGGAEEQHVAQDLAEDEEAAGDRGAPVRPRAALDRPGR